jgi:hypothetical protein
MLQRLQDPLLIFKQFGFKKELPATGGHVKGTCPFCGKDEHFYINIELDNRPWDCKKCGRHGGYQEFLQEVASFAEGKNLSELSKDRGISEKTLLDAGVGFMNGVWVLPVWDRTKKKILNVKIYDGSSFKNASGCMAAMYGLWLMPDTYENAYITEGEWDFLALKDAGAKAIIGAPGAGTFRTEILPMFLGKRVYVLYDNDDAGKRGQERAVNFLLPIAAEVQAIQWPQGTSDGYDVRDVYKSKGKETEKYLLSICERKVASRGGVLAIDPTMRPIDDIKEAYGVFHKWLHLDNDELLDVIFGTVLANRLQGDPVWLFIVAPPGGTKSEPLMTLNGCAGIETLSSLTPPTLISGHSLGGVDPSLIPLLDGKTLVIKDFTVIMGLPQVEREEIQAILRDAYDGECKRVFANGVTRSYKSHFGILAGVTPAIETYADENTRLGERFLRWRNWIPADFGSRRKYIQRALDNTAREDEMRMELSGSAKRILIADYSSRIPKLTKEINDLMINIADWIATLRGVVVRDKYRHNALYKPTPELGTRLCKELLKLFMGIAMLHGKVDKACFAAIRNVARSCVNVRYLELVTYIFRNGVDKAYSMKDLQGAIGLPIDTTSFVIDDLVLLKVLMKFDNTHWKLTKAFTLQTLNSKIYT